MESVKQYKEKVNKSFYDLVLKKVNNASKRYTNKIHFFFDKGQKLDLNYEGGGFRPSKFCLVHNTINPYNGNKKKVTFIRKNSKWELEDNSENSHFKFELKNLIGKENADGLIRDVLKAIDIGIKEHSNNLIKDKDARNARINSRSNTTNIDNINKNLQFEDVLSESVADAESLNKKIKSYCKTLNHNNDLQYEKSEALMATMQELEMIERLSKINRWKCFDSVTNNIIQNINKLFENVKAANNEKKVEKLERSYYPLLIYDQREAEIVLDLLDNKINLSAELKSMEAKLKELKIKGKGKGVYYDWDMERNFDTADQAEDLLDTVKDIKNTYADKDYRGVASELLLCRNMIKDLEDDLKEDLKEDVNYFPY